MYMPRLLYIRQYSFYKVTYEKQSEIKIQKQIQMAYSNKVSAVAVVLFIAVAIAPLLAEPQSPMFPKMDPVCARVMPDLLEKCFATASATPTEDCCSDLKSATTTQVTCLCDNYIANPAIVNITGPYSAGITTKCGVFDKYSCDGTSKGTYLFFLCVCARACLDFQVIILRLNYVCLFSNYLTA